MTLHTLLPFLPDSFDANWVMRKGGREVYDNNSSQKHKEEGDKRSIRWQPSL